jgi:hypothetical protein
MLTNTHVPEQVSARHFAGNVQFTMASQSLIDGILYRKSATIPYDQ